MYIPWLHLTVRHASEAPATQKEGHRNSAAAVASGDASGMTSAAQRNLKRFHTRYVQQIPIQVPVQSITIVESESEIECSLLN